MTDLVHPWLPRLDVETVRQMYGNTKQLLGSFYHIKTSKIGDAWMARAQEAFPGDRLLLDSGLFTFINNPNSDASKINFYQYATEYLEWSERQGFKGLMIDVDAQKFCTPKEMERIRSLFDPTRTFFVWHPQHGISPREFAADKPFCAFPIPESLAMLGRTRTRMAALHAAREFKAAGADRVHVLGTSRLDMRSRDTWSCDSTTWANSALYGICMMYERGRTVAVQRSSERFAQASQRTKQELPLAWAAMSLPWINERVWWPRVVGAREAVRAEIAMGETNP